MVFKRLRTRGVLLAAVPVIALGVAGAGVLTAANAAEPKSAEPGTARLNETAKRVFRQHYGAQLKAGQSAGKAAAKAAAKSGAAGVAAAGDSVLGDWNGDARADFLARDAAGRLWFYEGTGNPKSPYRARKQVGTNWQIYNRIVRHGDFNGDGKQDLLTRDTTGMLWFYAGTGAPGGNGYRSRVKVGPGYQIYTQIVGVDDWTGDDRDDFIAVDAAGRLWLYAGRGNATFVGRRQIGTSWHIYSVLVSFGDLTGDGASELVARDRAGFLWGYDSTGDPASPYSRRWRIPNENPETGVDEGWGGVTAWAGVGDLDAAGLPDLLMRVYTGELFLFNPEGDGAFPKIGTGWNIYNLLF